MSKETHTGSTFERRAALFMAFAGAISLMAIIGWVIGQPILASLRPEYIPMAPATASIFLGLCGCWFLERILPGRQGLSRLVQAGLVGMLIIVLILALRYFTGLGPDLENLLSPNPGLLGQFLTARMSPLSALGFFLAIPAVLGLTGRQRGKGIRTAAASLSLVVFILNSIFILGYLYGAPLFYGGTFIPVAITTALAFWFLSLGLLMSAGPACWPVSVFMGAALKARLLRAFIPASILTVLIQGLLSSINFPWISNPAVRVAVAALLAWLIVIFVIALLANNLSADMERGDLARMKAESNLKESEVRFRTLAETAKDAIINIDHNGQVVFWNRAAETIFGYSAGEINGKSLDMLMPGGFRAAHHQGVQHVVLTGETHIIGTTVEVVGLRKDGREFPLALSLATWQVAGDVFFTGIANDITERKRIELVQNAIYRISQATLTSEGIDALYHSIHAILGELIPAENFYIALYDPLKELISFPYYIDQFDEPPPAPTPLQGLTGYVIRTGRPLLAPTEVFDRLIQEGEIEAVGTTGEDWMGAPLIVERRMIGVMAVQSYSEEIHFDQEDLNLLEFVSTQVAQAIERKRMEEEIRSLSMTDELTGLYNRRGFTMLAEQEFKLAHRKKRRMLLVFGDVDDLKILNDTFGHAQGDLALKEVAAILKETFREADIPARIGGDEFVVLAVDAARESAEIVTRRIQASLEARNQHGDRPYQLGLSLGIVRYDPEFPCTVSELVAQADAVMYQRKQARKEKKL